MAGWYNLAMKNFLLTVFFLSCATSSAETVFLEAEQFKDRGGWSVDSLFIDQMGSSFLLAHGMGRPVKDASTTFVCPAPRTYTVWARTRNWTAPWSKHAAGTFKIVVGGIELANVLGAGSGEWQWQEAGKVTLVRGETTIALHDLTGFDGRCDAICLTTEKEPSARPPQPPISREVKADLVVCGGGVAGTCAAITAARLGLKVALVQDRPMLGGANSSEVRVHLGGHINLGPYPRLGDVVAEIGPAKGGNAQPAARYEDRRKIDAVTAEKNIELFLNTRVVAVEKDGDAIRSVVGRGVVDGVRTRFTAPLFADCTGDACVGALAGADFRVGREAKSETGEEMAAEKADKMVMGASVQWYTKETKEESRFPAEPWMIAFNEENCEHAVKGDWDWETGMMRDLVKDFEFVRDYGMLVVYSNWSFLKNGSVRKAEYARREFDWVAYVAGKRESRRLMGDHILTQQDVFEFRQYPDASFATTWPIDLHYPMPKNTKHYDGEPFRSICTHNKHYAYPVPYRCLYSRNVSNLFMAGRNISVTHVGLGTVRVMLTTGMMGEVVGMAARVCKDNSCRPRGVYEKHLDALKSLMKKGAGLGGENPPQKYNEGPLIPGVPPVTQPQETGWINLFNGKDLSGWTPKIRGYKAGENPGNTFRVVDGLLCVRYDDPMYADGFKARYGHLFYNRPFSNYVLRATYRMPLPQLKGGEGWAVYNNGLMLHGQTPESMEIDQDFPVSIEYQLLARSEKGKDRTTANLCTPGTNVEVDGKLYTPHVLNSTSKTYDPEEWTTVEVEVRGGERIIHRVEGKTVLEYEKPQYDPKDESAQKLIKAAGGDLILRGGTISIQSESSPTDFKSIMIRPL